VKPHEERSKAARLVVSATIVAVISTCASLHADWPRFRGPGGSGVAADADVPVEFGPEKNVVWQTPLPTGHSSPCVVGERIFLTAFVDAKDDQPASLETLCLDRSDGKILWRRGVAPNELERGSGLGNPATSTPTADGERVYAYFGAFGLTAWSHDGRELWRRPLPTPITGHGASTSPILVGQGRGKRLILAFDQDVGAYVMALYPATGRTAWKTPRPGCRRGFSTPIPWPPEAPTSVVLPGTLRVAAYAITDGAELWTVRGLPNEMVSSPVGGDGLIFVGGWTYGSGVTGEMPKFDALLAEGDKDGDEKLTREESPGGPASRHFTYIDADKDGFLDRDEWDSMATIFESAQNALLAVRPGGKGDVTGTHIVWKQTRGIPYVPSPLYYQGRVFIVKKGGIASCFDAKTGEALYSQKRIGDRGNYYSSPIAAGGKIFVASQRGEVAVLRASDELEVLARNKLGEPVMATPAIDGDRLLIRTRGALWAFGAAVTDAPKSKP